MTLTFVMIFKDIMHNYILPIVIQFIMQQSVIIQCNRCGTSTVHDQST